MKFFFQLSVLVIIVTLAGCSSTYKEPTSSTGVSYYNVSKPIQCVPYARELSGIEIRGDAHTWWHKAQGRYSQGRYPEPGAVMVLSRTQKMRHGHVAVVKNIVSQREIEVAHSNWGYNRETRSKVYNNMRVKDISANNDWSKVRFWDYPSGTFGRVYPVSGFIYKHE